MTTAQPAIDLGDGDLSAIYQSADQVSAAGQRITKRLVRTESLRWLVVASLTGVTVVRVTSHELDVRLVSGRRLSESPNRSLRRQAGRLPRRLEPRPPASPRPRRSWPRPSST